MIPALFSHSPVFEDFKKKFCDENRLIGEALRGPLHRFLRAPILDVGAGLGDIAQVAFPDLDAILLDLCAIPQSPKPRHAYHVGDFLDYDPPISERPKTILLCHVLQYLDDRLDAFRNKIDELNPEVIIEVTNDNVGVFGRLIAWSKDNIPHANPEVRLRAPYPDRYGLSTFTPIRATLRCPNFNIMARHFVEVLIDAPSVSKSINLIEEKLSKKLQEPTIQIDQTVYCFERPTSQ